jgi:hypothetical protein
MFYSDIKLSRIDVAIDSSKKPNLKTISDNVKRIMFKYKNRIYFKTSNEKKINQHLAIKYYHKKTIHITTHRIEFCFKKRHLDSNKDDIKEHCQKIIQKALGYQVEIDFSLLATHQTTRRIITPSLQNSRIAILTGLTSSRPIKLINKIISKVVNYAKNIFKFKRVSRTLSNKKAPTTKPNHHIRE